MSFGCVEDVGPGAKRNPFIVGSGKISSESDRSLISTPGIDAEKEGPIATKQQK